VWRLKTVINISASVVAATMLSACASGGHLSLATRALNNESKYAAYITPSGQHIVPARPFKPVPPIYPPEAMYLGTVGEFRVCFDINKNGQVENPRIVKQQGNAKGKGFAQLRYEVLRIIKRWYYAPKTIDGKPVAGKDCQNINFTINR